ncbi:MAG: transglycosylase SLT domain-containing protein, partial [Bdellovibrionales bacterium]|nr:transglycosylase SLT domain-containing protein [Bdellovibrionales bacterium]
MAPGAAEKRNPAFSVPSKLRGRVNFWVDIFTKHGENTVVFHHRAYPQAIFDVQDLTERVRGMGDVAREKYRTNFVKSHTKVVKQAIENLSWGRKPKNALERRIAEQMEFLGAGNSKFRKILTEDLLRTQTGIREKYIEAIKRSGRYLPIIEKIFAEYGLPVELTRLPFIESSFDYTAYSSVGAAGIWQFMPRTAKYYKLTINSAIDERRDPIASTRAAAQYLKSSYATLGTWPLAVTSYNHGPYGVAKAIKKMGTKNIATIVEHPTVRPFGFASNNFYPEFLAALEVYRDREFLFPGIKVEPQLQFDLITMSGSMSVSTVARKLGLPVDSLKPLNYALSKRVWDERLHIPKGFTLKVPPGYGTKA